MGVAENANKFLKKFRGLIIIAVIGIVLLIVLCNCFSIVNEGFIGVKYRFGRIVKSDITAGLCFKAPFIEEIQQVDIRERVYTAQADAYTSDTQNVDNLILKLNYYFDSSRLQDIIRQIGVTNVESKLIVPYVAKTAKDEIGKVRAEDLVQNRSAVQNAILNSLRDPLAEQGIVVTAFAIENLAFDSAFENSIQQKVIAAQEALRMQNETVKKEEEAKQKLIEAEADAKAQKLRADAEAYAIEVAQKQLDNSPNYVEYIKATKWDGILPQVMGNEVNPFLALGSVEQTVPSE